MRQAYQNNFEDIKAFTSSAYAGNTALAMDECVTPNRPVSSGRSFMLRRFSLTCGWPAEAMV
jgi:hypothetical protein